MNTLRAEVSAATLRLRTRWAVSAIGCRRAPPLHRRTRQHPPPLCLVVARTLLCEAALQAKKKKTETVPRNSGAAPRPQTRTAGAELSDRWQNEKNTIKKRKSIKHSTEHDIDTAIKF